MEPRTVPSSWVQIVIDLRSKDSRARYDRPPERHGPSILADRQKKNLPTEPQTRSFPNFPMLLSSQQKKNQPPVSPKNKPFHPFGDGLVDESNDKYFGGPIIDITLAKWRQTNYTRCCGEVIGAKESDIPLPFNISKVVKSVAVMSSTHKTQSAIWVGPRLLLSTLDLHPWIQGYPSAEECDLLRRIGQTFDVESEICSRVLSTFSPKVQLLEFSVENNIGIFQLQDHYPPRTDYINPEWLLERDEVRNRDLQPGRKVACVGYSGQINEEDAAKIKHEAAVQLEKAVPQLLSASLNEFRGVQSLIIKQLEQINLDAVTKPSMKSFAPGTLDYAEVRDEITLFGVSASLWKGSSGGPCIMLDREEGGAIIGLVRGYELLSDPYNLVNGFPAGLKQLLQKYI